ncbi:DUF642 domain-containing protein [Micromonospora tarensis]|uniref:DUF642 domain-containing protein n=1 Tax=Micromonospora tarensis TaxID=2806100 RepID=A0ABS1YLB7_9ACTN|nr:DUF642 domain-containing protein [Micromonospora tarensis]MBM0278238.1 DUF642 domain-containing protein [Micromonospora tarensis]
MTTTWQLDPHLREKSPANAMSPTSAAAGARHLSRITATQPLSDFGRLMEFESLAILRGVTVTSLIGIDFLASGGRSTTRRSGTAPADAHVGGTCMATRPGTYRTVIGAALAVALSVVLTALTASPAAAATVFTDGFENPVISGDFTEFAAGQQIGSWTVTTGTVGLTRDWQAAEGDQSLDLNGFSPGAVARTLPTKLLTTYRVSYALAGNPDNGPLIATGRVTANGQTVDSFSFDTTGHTPSDMGYVYRTFYFTNVLSAATVLQFASTTADAFGPVIDDVRVESCLLVICPAGTATAI